MIEIVCCEDEREETFGICCPDEETKTGKGAISTTRGRTLNQASHQGNIFIL